jgi:mannose-6-phosphate isomerase-like protein (cupin superfamily)
MDTRFNDIFTEPQNEIFQVVFYPDRVYHAEYLNATRSPRYRYNVREVRNIVGAMVMKGHVFLDDKFLTNFVRIEYKPDRLVELAREKNRFLRGEIMAWMRLLPEDNSKTAESIFKMHFCPWIDAYQVEIWETLEPPAGVSHDYQILDIMGKDASITRIRQFAPALGKTDDDLKALKQMELAFRENDKDLPFNYRINDTDVSWDNNYLRSHQEPRSPEPSSFQNTVQDSNYLIDFQRGWILDSQAVQPVRYRNAMMDPTNPDIKDDNIIEMKWLMQRQFGGSTIFFHEVTIPPGKVEGTHRHIGTEELYYITEGSGLMYIGLEDDPSLDDTNSKVVDRDVYGFGMKQCREVPVRAGNGIFTKSGGIHGIRNNSNAPLKFVAFLYHTN